MTDKKTDRIFGIHIVVPNVGELIAKGVLAMKYGASSEDIAKHVMHIRHYLRSFVKRLWRRTEI